MKDDKIANKNIKDIKSIQQNINMVLRQGLVFCWLHGLTNTQGKIDGTYLGNLCMEYTRNV